MKNLSLLGLLLLVFFSCRQDIDEDGKIEITQDPPVVIGEYDPTSELVDGTIYGRVYDENEIAVENALVKYEGKTFRTDVEGRFLIENEPLDRQGTFFTVEADGYFKGSRRIYPKDGSVNYAYVQLLALDEIGSFFATDGGEVSDDFGLNISFPENSIQSSTGSIYNGEVTVAAKWLDPTAPNIAEIMPGDLLGLSARVEEVSLVTYGMMAVELFDEDGNNVNIAEGNMATLSFPVPQELINEAPTEIPLWSFYDEEYGIWAEEGTATLQGNNYVGQVSHFSFWNCDVPFPIVYIEGQLVTEDGTPLPNTTICIYADGSSSGRCGITDNEGFFAGKMPKDSDLVLKFGYQGQNCEFNSINLGSFSTDENLGSIQVTESGAAFTVTGSIVDCNSDPVTNGLVKFQIGNTISEYYVGDDGSFEIAILDCDNATEISITPVDINKLEEGDPQIYLIGPDIDFGILSACGNALTEFFILNVDGQAATTVDNIRVIFEENDTLPLLSIGVDSINLSQFNFSLRMQSGAIGTYDINDSFFLFIDLFEPTFTVDSFVNCQGPGCPDISSFEMIITEFGGEGGHWAGEFNGVGNFIDRNNDTITYTYPFSGEFRIPIQ